MSKLANGGQAVLPTGTGGVVIDVGFAPKAVLLVVQGEPVVSGTKRLSYSVGAVVGSTQRFAASAGTATNAANAVTSYYGDNGCGRYAEITLSAVIAGTEVTVTPASSVPTAGTIMWYAFGGDDVEVALRSTVFNANTTTTVNDCGFTPTCVLFGGGRNQTLNTVITTQAPVSFGALVSESASAFGFGFHPVTSTNGTNIFASALRGVNTYGSTAWLRPTLTTALVPGGFSITNNDNPSGTPAEPGWTWALCLRGMRVGLRRETLLRIQGEVLTVNAGFRANTALLMTLPDAGTLNFHNTAPQSVGWGVSRREGGEASSLLMSGHDTNRTGIHLTSSTFPYIAGIKTGVNTYALRHWYTSVWNGNVLQLTLQNADGVTGGQLLLLLFEGASTELPPPPVRRRFSGVWKAGR